MLGATRASVRCPARSVNRRGIGLSGVSRRRPEALRTLPRDTAAFIGRSRELDRLVAAARETTAVGGVVGIHAVDGMAGIGKTTPHGRYTNVTRAGD